MKKKLTVYLTLIIVMLFTTPMIVFAGYADSIAGGKVNGGGSSGCSNTSNCWRFNNNGNHSGVVFGVRVTMVDTKGNRIEGTHSVDYLTHADYNLKNDSTFRGVKIYRNASRKTQGYKKYVQQHQESIDFTAQSLNDVRELSKENNYYFKNTSFKGNVANYFIKLSNQTKGKKSIDAIKNTTFYKNFIAPTGYDLDKYNECQEGTKKTLESETAVAEGEKGNHNVAGTTCTARYNDHYVTVEPMSIVTSGGVAFFATGTELELLYERHPSSFSAGSRVPSTLSIIIHYPGKFSPGGSQNNGFWFYKADTFSRNRENSKKVLHNRNGYALGVFWMGDALDEEVISPPMCDFDNPEDFYTTDADGDEIINTETNCCSTAVAQGVATQAQINERYPVCNQCSPKTTVKNAVCLQDDKETTINDDTLSCISRVGKKNKKKYQRKINKYCYIYCREDISIKFPSSPSKTIAKISPGGTFIWPGYEINVDSASVTGNRECKMKVKAAEWLYDYENGDEEASDTSKLVTKMNECLKAGTLSGHEYTLSPNMKLTYNPGSGSETISMNLKKKEIKASTSTKQNWGSTGTFNKSKVSNLEALAKIAENRLLKSTATYQYVLPDDLNKYYSKLTGETEKNVDPKRLDIVDQKRSALKVSEKAQENKDYDIKIDYANLSSTKGHETKYDSSVKAYSCNYQVNKSIPDPQCDINEPMHFLDINKNGTSGDDTSGPNGENCCYVIYQQYGPDSEQYKQIKHLCGDHPTPSCTYPNDISSTSDYVTKKRCCAELAVSKKPEDVKMYKEYCTSGPGDGGDPYCPQDCENGKCTVSPMTQALRNCMNGGKSYDECKVDNCPGGSILIYRPISLIANEAFPGVNKTNRIWSNNNWYYYSNWAYRGKKTASVDRDYYVKQYITNNREKKEYDIYNYTGNDIMYKITLDASTIRTIRSHNARTSYDDFNLECNPEKKNGRQCKSKFIREKLAGKVTGCGVNSNWYACPGVSVKRGD